MTNNNAGVDITYNSPSPFLFCANADDYLSSSFGNIKITYGMNCDDIDTSLIFKGVMSKKIIYNICDQSDYEEAKKRVNLGWKISYFLTIDQLIEMKILSPWMKDNELIKKHEYLHEAINSNAKIFCDCWTNKTIFELEEFLKNRKKEDTKIKKHKSNKSDG
ncbi:hypothetical protein [Fangia hongkongensis]|uniref:hypothetical protein n=1 Tax=Fangia hongkongensis TaxID=270495 RepID=UPI0003804E0E|nr:hypothetical protein [Fangia hongkongensis]